VFLSGVSFGRVFEYMTISGHKEYCLVAEVALAIQPWKTATNSTCETCRALSFGIDRHTVYRQNLLPPLCA
jgi:hypothetical protein